MNRNPTQEETKAMLKWFNQNRRNLIDRYRNQYVAYDANGIITHGENLEEVLKVAEDLVELYLIYLVPATQASAQFLTIRFRTVVRHDWIPSYPVKLKHNDKEILPNMLVDSGADISLISLKVGQHLGYALADAEQMLVADSVGGKVQYVVRQVEMTINGYSFIAPVAWLQDNGGGDQLLLGRDVVFDKFNIEFQQADEEIIFTWRG